MRVALQGWAEKAKLPTTAAERELASATTQNLEQPGLLRDAGLHQRLQDTHAIRHSHHWL
jgi:hypothetical protein